MHRWFPIPALLVVGLWAVVAAGPPTGRPAWPRAEWAAWPTLAIHGGLLAWSRGGRGGGWPEWARVQEEKHRRKAAWFAAWGLVVDLAGHGGPVGVALNLGFQPGVLLAEWATIAAEDRLVRSMAGRQLG